MAFGFDLVFTNRHGEWPVAVKWESAGKALCGSSEGAHCSRAVFKVSHILRAHGQACDIVLYDLHGKVLLNLERRGSEVPSEMQYHWTDLDNAQNQRYRARKDQICKQAEQWTTPRDVTTFDTKLVTEAARLLMDGRTVSGRWLRVEVMPGSTMPIETPWNLSFCRAGYFCLTCGRNSKRWCSVEEFVNFFVETNDKEMAACFVSIETKSTDEVSRVEGTLQRAALQQMVRAG